MGAVKSKTLLSKKSTKILFFILAFGVILTTLPFLIAQPQCSNNYTSNCTIGADIGSGMLFLFGISIIFVSLFGLGISLLANAVKIPSKSFQLAAGLVLIGLLIIVLGVINAPVSNKEAIFKAAGCSEDAEELKDICFKPKSSPDAIIDYSNSIIFVGATSLFGGILLYLYDINKHRIK